MYMYLCGWWSDKNSQCTSEITVLLTTFGTNVNISYRRQQQAFTAATIPIVTSVTTDPKFLRLCFFLICLCTLPTVVLRCCCCSRCRLHMRYSSLSQLLGLMGCSYFLYSSSSIEKDSVEVVQPHLS